MGKLLAYSWLDSTGQWAVGFGHAKTGPSRGAAPGVPQHVTQRGNNRQDVFFVVDDDQRACLQVLAEQAERFDLRVLGYCLMTNHVHPIVVPEGEESLAKGAG